MAVALSGEAVGTQTFSGATSASITNVTTAGSDRCGIAAAMSTDGAPIATATATWNAVAVNSFTAVTTTEGDYELRATLLGLVAPATAASTVAFTFSDATSGVAAALSFTGVDQTTPLGASATGNGDTDTPSVTVATSADEFVIDAVCFFDSSFNSDTPAAGASQTKQWDLGHSFGYCGVGSTQDGADDAGAMTWTLNIAAAGDRHWAQVVVSLKAAGGGGGGGTLVKDIISMGFIPFAR